MSFFRSKGFKAWYAVEAIPIYVIIGSACAGAGWYLTRLARGSQVIWTYKNPEPWNNIQPDQGTKFLSVNQQHPGGHWKRGGW